MATKSPRVAGVGMTAFATPKRSRPYTELAAEAARQALEDAGIDYPQIQQVYAGYVYGDSTSGQRAVYEVGLTGAPVINVNNNCSTGSTALFLARQAVESGAVDCALALGFEQMPAGALGEQFTDRPSPIDPFLAVAERRQGASDTPMALRLFGSAGRDYAETHGTKLETFAKVAVKARAHAAQNPNAVFRDPLSVDEVMASPMMYAPVLTRLQCCPPTCGAAAAVVVSDDFARRHGLDHAVRIRAQAMRTDTASTFDGDMTAVVGAKMTRATAQAVYDASGVDPADVRVVELHDCFTVNEILTYEGLGLAPAGGAERLVEDGDNTYGGRHVVNPSGGLLAKGHPLGATGLAQCFELVRQLRGLGGGRQVEGAKLALQHNLGLGGACVVTLYEA
jgi:acetyl-CoA acyltransferase